MLVITLTSCTSFINYSNEHNNKKVDTKSELTNKQQIIVAKALQSTQMSYNNSLLFDGKKFTNDCSGLIYGIFWSANIDLISATSKERGNGVKRLYQYLENQNLIHRKKLPNPGDLVFWNNTYGNWKQNPLSHVGVVVSVDNKTGQIEYVHNNTYLGAIKKESMNLYKPHENRPINNYIRYDSKYKKTSAELFDSFGMAWQL